MRTRVLLLLNAVSPDELYDDQDYRDILDDITEECSKYGEVEGVKIPRPVPKIKTWLPTEQREREEDKARKTDKEAGVGRVYVLYRTLDQCKKAMDALAGRDFGGRTILTANVSEDTFHGPQPPPPPEPDFSQPGGLKYLTNG